MKTKRLGLLVVMALLLSVASATAITMVSPPDNHWTNYPQIQFSFVLENASGNQSPDCELLFNLIPQNTTLHNSTEDNQTIYHFTHDLQLGRHTWHISCQDANTTHNTTPQSITLDNTSPLITIFQPNQSVYDKNNISIKFQAQDDLDPELDCELSLEGNTYNNHQSLTLANTTNHSTEVSLQDGTYNLSIRCEDNATNQATESLQFDVDTAQPFFEVDLSPTNPSIGDTVTFTVKATNHSDVDLTVVAPNTNTYVWDYNNQLYPKTETLPYTKRAGTYTLVGTMKYEDSSIALQKELTIKSNLGVEISGSTVINERQSTTLTAEPLGGFPPYQISWKLTNDTIVNDDAYTREYTIRGTYKEVVRINDSQGNTYTKEIKVTVKRVYNTTIEVVDFASKEPLKNALVEIDNLDDQTDENGNVFFNLTEGEKDLYVTKTAYQPYEKEITIDANKTITVELKKKDVAKPNITLETEENQAFDDTVTLSFRVKDKGRLVCMLYLNDKNDDWYTLHDTKENITPDTIASFTLDNLTGTSYQWKIECEDEEGNTAFSKERSFRLLDDETKTVLNDADDAAATIADTIASLDALDKNAQQAAQALNFQKRLERAKREIERAQRDINNIGFRKDLTVQEKADQRQALQEKIATLVATTPTGIAVRDTTSFVTYPDEADIQSALEYALSPEEATTLLDTNLKVQEKLTATTIVYHIDLTYPDTSQSMTVVHKQLVINDTGPYFLVEHIPKTFASSVEKLMVVQDFEVLNPDPVLRFRIEEEIVYSVNDSVSFEVLKEAKTVLVSRQPPAETGPTGFSISKVSGSPYSIGAVILFGILIAVLVLRKTGLLKKKKQTSHLTMPEQPSQKTGQQSLGAVQALLGNLASRFKRKPTNDPRMDMLIQQAFYHLGANQLEDALTVYSQASNHYGQLDPGLQHTYLGTLTELCYSIDANTVRQMLNTLHTDMATGEVEASMSYFHQIQAIFEKLPDTYRQNVAEPYYQAHHKVEELRSMILHKLKQNDDDQGS